MKSYPKLRSAFYCIIAVATILRIIGIYGKFYPPHPARPAPTADQPNGVCHIENRASVKMEITDRFLLVPMVINLVPKEFFVDTGSQQTVISEAGAYRLALTRDKFRKSHLQGFGGSDSQALALPESLSLGGLALHRNVSPPDDSLAVGPLQLPMFAQPGSPPIGALGQDYLSAFDIDIDTINDRFTLTSVSDCGNFVPWPARVISAAQRGPVGLVFPVALNGVKLNAILDTAAQSTVVLASGVAKLHLSAACNSVTIQGLGHNRPTACPQMVSLEIADQTLPTFSVVATSLTFTNQIDVMIGLDWLRGHHVWISNATNRLFVAD